MTTETKLTKQEEAEADYFDKIEVEGGFFMALDGYGLSAKKYALSKADKAELQDIETQIGVLKMRAMKVLDRFQKSSEKRCNLMGGEE